MAVHIFLVRRCSRWAWRLEPIPQRAPKGTMVRRGAAAVLPALNWTVITEIPAADWTVKLGLTMAARVASFTGAVGPGHGEGDGQRHGEAGLTTATRSLSVQCPLLAPVALILLLSWGGW